MTDMTEVATEQPDAERPDLTPDDLSHASGDNLSPASPRDTKISMVIGMLERKEGATLDEMVEATGWQKHTIRAAMTGLRKKGHVIDRGKRGDDSCYHIGKAG